MELPIFFSTFLVNTERYFVFFINHTTTATMREPLSATLRIALILCFLPFFSSAQGDFALLFDGLDDEVTIFAGPTFDGGGNLTFETWINPSSIGTIQSVASWTDGGTINAVFSLDESGFLDLFQDDGGGGNSSKGSTAILANEWTHIAFALNAGSISFYVNGQEEVIGAPLTTAAGISQFAMGSSLVNANFDGLLDEARVWNNFLDQTMIQNQMFTSLTGSEGDLIAYYRFNQITGIGLPDASPSGFDMTLNNFPGPTDPSWQNSTALTQTFSVTNINDDLAGSLRQAITDANLSGADNVEIDFDIPGVGPWAIALVTDLPTITSPMTINGKSQAGWDFASGNMVSLDLSGVASGDGFNVLAADVSIIGIKIVAAEFGIVINGGLYDNVVIQENIFNSTNNIAINIINGDNVTIQGNHIGVSGDGLSGTGGATGIALFGTDGAIIGGDRMTGEGNMIAGSAFSSYLINISSSDNITVEGNIIGASLDGNDITTSRGVLINNTNNVSVGNVNADRRNYINGMDDSFGLSVSNGDMVDIVNNYIGIGIDDSHTIGNNSGNAIPGITSSNGLTNFTIDGNVIAGANHGIQIGGNATGGSIVNNLIGLEPDGITAFGNATHGINFLGSFLGTITVGGAGNENIIAYNDSGIRIDQTSFGTVDIDRNSIFCNTTQGINIAGTAVVDPPVITNVTASDIIGTSGAEDLSVVNVYQVDLSCMDNQGATFIGATTVNTGNWTFSGVIDDTRTYVAVVNDGTNGSSEFSTSFGPGIAPGGVGGNLVLWLKADASTTIATGVSNWTDQSTAGNDVTQGTGANQPGLITGALNYQPVLTFDGTDDLSTTNTGLIGGGDYTKIVVSRVTSGTGAHNILSAGGSGRSCYLLQ